MPDAIAGIDHVQIAAHPGCEDAARRFYGGVLRLEEIPKPETLRARGGVWFACGAQQLHVGVEEDFQPARRAHPAFRTRDEAALEALAAQCEAAGAAVAWDTALPGVRRFYVSDPFGNRVEVVAPPAPAADVWPSSRPTAPTVVGRALPIALAREEGWESLMDMANDLHDFEVRAVLIEGEAHVQEDHHAVQGPADLWALLQGQAADCPALLLRARGIEEVTVSPGTSIEGARFRLTRNGVAIESAGVAVRARDLTAWLLGSDSLGEADIRAAIAAATG